MNANNKTAGRLEIENNKYLHKTELYLKIAEEAQKRRNEGDPYYLLSFYRCLSFALYWIEEYELQGTFFHLSTIEDFKCLVGADQAGLVLFISHGDNIKIQKLKNIERE